MNIIQTTLSFEQITTQKINNLVSSKNIINKNYNGEISKIQNDFNNNRINNDEKDQKINQLNNSRNNELNNIDNEISILKKQLDVSSNNPYKNIITQNNSLVTNIKSSLKDVTSYNSVLSKEQSTKILNNITKSLIPTLSLQLNNKLINVATQNKKIEELVDSVNSFINNIKTQDDINKAQILRNSAINTINNSENKILSIRNVFSQLNSFISIFSLIVSTLSSLPIPLGAPIGVGIPMNIVLKVTKSIESANKLVLGLNTILGICIITLSRLINDLEVQKSRLENINGLLDNATINSLSDNQLQNFLDSLKGNSNNLGNYKGFTFVLKEEENPKFNVEGNKRHYAVAINNQGIIVMQSDYSFTLDPQVLVDQLRLLIDKSNIIS